MFRQGGSNDVTLDRISRRADCWDNAPIERFFASLKKELVHDADFTTRAAVPGRRSSSPSRSSTITSGDPPRWGMCSRWRTSGKTVNPRPLFVGNSKTIFGESRGGKAIVAGLAARIARAKKSRKDQRGLSSPDVLRIFKINCHNS